MFCAGKNKVGSYTVHIYTRLARTRFITTLSDPSFTSWPRSMIITLRSIYVTIVEEMRACLPPCYGFRGRGGGAFLAG